VSERRACRVVGQHRSTQRYERLAPEYELRLVERMNEIAAKHPRWGYRRVWSLLRGEGWRVNRKRIERLWRAEGHRVPPRRRQASGKRAQGTAEQAIWNLPAQRPNHIWSYDFMGARTRDGSPVRILNVVDEYTRLALGSRVARSIGARDVIAELEQLFARHGKPEVLRVRRPPFIWSIRSVVLRGCERPNGGDRCPRSATAWVLCLLEGRGDTLGRCGPARASSGRSGRSSLLARVVDHC